mgnify:CR=1 FL=1
MSMSYHDFDEVTRNGRRFVIAQPRRESDEAVQFDGQLAIEEDEDEGPWTDVVSQLIQFDLTGALNLESGKGSIRLDQAVDSLVESEDQVAPITSPAQARAVIDYYAAHGVVEVDQDKVVLLEDPNELTKLDPEEADPDEETQKLKMLKNWVAAIGGCIDEIEDTMRTIEEAKSELEQGVDDVGRADKQQKWEDEMEEIRKEILQITGGKPPGEADLNEQAQAEFERLRKEYYQVERALEALEPETDWEQKIEEMAANLELQRKDLNRLKEVLEEKQNSLNRAYTLGDAFPQEAVRMAENLGNIVNEISNINQNVEERMESESEAEFFASIQEAEEGDTATDELIDAVPEEDRDQLADQGENLNYSE